MEHQPPEGRDERNNRPRAQRFQFGPWFFNVNRAHAIIAESPREASSLPVEPWAKFRGFDTVEGAVALFAARNLDRDYAMTTDLEEPVVVAVLRDNDGEEFPLLIDGTHRLYRAYTEHVTELPAYVLTAEESLAIREDGIIYGSGRWRNDDGRRLPDTVDPPEAGTS